MRLGWLALAPLALLASAAGAEDLPADLRAAAVAFDRAQADGDRATLERLIADDYVLINSEGKRESKADLVNTFTAPEFDIEPFTVEQPVEMHLGDSAILAGVADLKGKDRGNAFALRLRFVDVWAKRNGRWQVVFAQVSREPATN